MSGFKETVGELLSRLAILLRLKPSKEAARRALREQLKRAQADNYDTLETLKEEIQKLEKQAEQKTKEHEKSRGDVQRILVQQIKDIYHQIDLKKGTENITVGNLNGIGVSLAKLDELAAAEKSGASSEKVEQLSEELAENIDGLKERDLLVKHVQSATTYSPPESETTATKTEEEKELPRREEQPEYEIPEEIKKRQEAMKE